MRWQLPMRGRVLGGERLAFITLGPTDQSDRPAMRLSYSTCAAVLTLAYRHCDVDSQ